MARVSCPAGGRRPYRDTSVCGEGEGLGCTDDGEARPGRRGQGCRRVGNKELWSEEAEVVPGRRGWRFTVGTLRNRRRALASPAEQADAANAGLQGHAAADQF